MNELPELPIPPESRQIGLARLQRAIASEHRRRRRRQFTIRALLAGVVLFGVWSYAPETGNRDLQPLVGLADAIAGPAKGGSATSDGPWYSRSDRIDLVSVPAEYLEGLEVEAFQFLLPSSREAWYEVGGEGEARVTYGQPQFLSAGDEHIFDSARLAEHYPVGEVVEGPVSLAALTPFEVTPADDEEVLLSILRRQVTGRGDRRLEEVEMLRMAGNLMLRYANQPAVRGVVLRAIADIPGIQVRANPDTVEVLFDYVDGDRPLRLLYEFDAETAQLVGESLARLATQSEPSTVLWQTTFSMAPVDHPSES